MIKSTEHGRRKFLRRAALLGGSFGVTARLIPSQGALASQGSAAPPDPGRLQKSRDDVDVYRDPKYYCGPGPSPLVLPGGKLLMGFRRSPDSGHSNPEVEMCLLTSEDEGRTWSGTPRVFDAGNIRNSNLTLLPEDNILHASHASRLITKGLYEKIRSDPRNEWRARHHEQWNVHSAKTGTYVRLSHDNGRTWSQRYWVSPVSGMRDTLPGWPSPTAIRNPAFVLSDRSLVIPVYSADRPETSYLMESADGGMHWRLRGTIARPDAKTGFNEIVLYECASGKLVAFMRSNPAGYSYTSHSLNGGRNWSHPRKEAFWGYPCTAIRMPSGRVLLAYGYRREPFGIRARLLDAECERIAESEEFVIRDDGHNRDLGYPLADLLPDGTAIVAYYFNSVTDGGKQKYIAASFLREA